MKYTLTRIAAALPRRALGLALDLAHPLLRRLEKRLTVSALTGSRGHPPVFIIGAPRSGSTLMYKVLVECFGFAYINNFSANFYRTLYLGSALSKRLGISPPSGFDIRYGTMKGCGAPHESGSFWYRWFPSGLDIHTPPGVLGKDAIEEVRREVLSTSNLYGGSMAFKNLFNSLRIGALVECFPDAIFIVCRRDPLQNALSLLRGRVEHNGDKHAWWTLPPREVHELKKLHYAQQVAGQVFHIERQIDADLERYCPDRFVTVGYEEFCADVHGSLQRIGKFLDSHGVRAATKLGGIPGTFATRPVTGLSAADQEAVQQSISALYGSESHA